MDFNYFYLVSLYVSFANQDSLVITERDISDNKELCRVLCKRIMVEIAYIQVNL